MGYYGIEMVRKISDNVSYFRDSSSRKFNLVFHPKLKKNIVPPDVRPGKR